jgi:hypothetical protein
MPYPDRHPHISRAARSHQTKRESSAAYFYLEHPRVSEKANNEFSPIGQCIKDV